nr:hypothetical protein [uncultured Noviherbaspirillum sp.]
MNQQYRILLLRRPSLLPGLLLASACQAREPSLSSSATARIFENPKESRMWMTVDTRRMRSSMGRPELASSSHSRTGQITSI